MKFISNFESTRLIQSWNLLLQCGCESVTRREVDPGQMADT